jgi:hypothetical protein
VLEKQKWLHDLGDDWCVLLQWGTPLFVLLRMAGGARWNKMTIWLQGKKVTQKLHWDQGRAPSKYHRMWNRVRLHIGYWLIYALKKWALPHLPLLKKSKVRNGTCLCLFLSRLK